MTQAVVSTPAPPFSYLAGAGCGRYKESKREGVKILTGEGETDLQRTLVNSLGRAALVSLV